MVALCLFIDIIFESLPQISVLQRWNGGILTIKDIPFSLQWKTKTKKHVSLNTFCGSKSGCELHNYLRVLHCSEHLISSLLAFNEVNSKSDLARCIEQERVSPEN